jgi:hypothetical protein
LAHGEAEARHFLMRVFMVAHSDGYQMMPGGLTRITPGVDHYSVSMSEGGTSKDTWVLSPPESPSLDHPLPHTGPVRLRRSTAELTSRDADNLFWMGRYLERTDFNARLMRLLFVELRETTGDAAARALLPLLRTALSEQADVTEIDWLDAERRLSDLVWSPATPGSIGSNITALHHAAFAVKRLSLTRASHPLQPSTTHIPAETQLDPPNPGQLGSRTSSHRSEQTSSNGSLDVAASIEPKLIDSSSRPSRPPCPSPKHCWATCSSPRTAATPTPAAT